MRTYRQFTHPKLFALILALSLIASGSILPNTANSATSGSETVGFSIVGGDMGGGGGGGDTCTPSDYSLSTSLGAAVDDPAAGTVWTSSDINIVQNNGTSCPGNTVLSAQSLDISASNFTNNLNSAPNIYCDGVLDGNAYTGNGTTDSCSSSTLRVNIEVFVPADAASGVTYQSTVTITAVL